METYIHAGVLASLSPDDEQAVWADHIDQLTELLADTKKADPDLAFCLDLAARRAAASGFPERANAACDLAREQLTRLGKDAEADKLEQMVQDLLA